MKKLIIVGAGEQGKELYAWCESDRQNEFKVVGFLDDNPDSLNNADIPCEILGTPSSYVPERDDVFICAISSPSSKRQVVNALIEKSATFVNYIHPTAIISRHVTIGVGNIFGPYVYVGPYTVIGDHNSFNVTCTVGHDVKVGSYCVVNCHADITGRVVLGDESFMGSHASIIPGKILGHSAKIAAGSVAMWNVADNSTVIGVPAKKLV